MSNFSSSLQRAAAGTLPVSAHWSIEGYFSINRNLRFHFGFHRTTFVEWTCLLMANYLRHSPLSVCLSELEEIDGWRGTDGTCVTGSLHGRWAPGMRCCPRSWGSQGRAAAGVRAETDLWVPGGAVTWGFVQTAHPVKTVRGYSAVEINACQRVNYSKYTHSQKVLQFTNFIKICKIMTMNKCFCLPQKLLLTLSSTWVARRIKPLIQHQDHLWLLSEIICCSKITQIKG